MSHIPASAVPHAKSHDSDDDQASATESPSLAERANATVGQATETVKANPKAAIAIGATLVAGIAAALAAPSVFAKAKKEPKKKTSGTRKAK